MFREKEAAKDTEDRKKELDEIDELKSAIYADPKLADPAEEFQRRLQERERQFLPGSEAARDSRSRSRSLASQPRPVVPASATNTANSPITLDADSPPDLSPDIQVEPQKVPSEGS